MGDIKDKNVPSITTQVAASPLQGSIRHASRLLEDNDYSAILFCGDLTSRGCIPKYKECVEYLVQALELNKKSISSIHVVPGNHDVSRSLCTDKKAFNPTKFEPLAKAWACLSEDAICIQGVREETYNVNGCSLQVLSMNSCMGCGEWHLYPENLRAEMEKVLSARRASEPKRMFEIEGDQLDTPMFDHDDIETANQRIQAAPIDSIPIVAAHHNLLPQELTRLEVYTELINSGCFRSTMSSMSRPLLYCHGHIHDDPIEIISSGKELKSQLICVSAPEIEKGFNEIKVYYSDGNKPLGVEIVMHRARPGGTFYKQSHIVRFFNRSIFSTPEIEAIRKFVTQAPVSFSALKSDYECEQGKTIQAKTFAKHLEEAEWLGIINIENKHDINYWNIKRAI